MKDLAPHINKYAKQSVELLTLARWNCSGLKVSISSGSFLVGWLPTEERKPSRTPLKVNFFILCWLTGRSSSQGHTLASKWRNQQKQQFSYFHSDWLQDVAMAGGNADIRLWRLTLPRFRLKSGNDGSCRLLRSTHTTKHCNTHDPNSTHSNDAKHKTKSKCHNLHQRPDDVPFTEKQTCSLRSWPSLPRTHNNSWQLYACSTHAVASDAARWHHRAGPTQTRRAKSRQFKRSPAVSALIGRLLCGFFLVISNFV